MGDMTFKKPDKKPSRNSLIRYFFFNANDNSIVEIYFFIKGKNTFLIVRVDNIVDKLDC